MKEPPSIKTLTTENGELVYQIISSEPITIICEEFPTAFSVLVAHTEEDAVTESAFVYDVSRDMEVCKRITEQLWKRGTPPCELRDTIAELL